MMMAIAAAVGTMGRGTSGLSVFCGERYGFSSI
jgi:hypothetical protein